MRLQWYWPFVRAEELGLARAVAALGDDLVLQTIGGRVAPDAALATVTRGFDLRADVPDVPPRSEGSIRWLASRATVYPRRARARERLAASIAPDVVHVVYLNYFTDGLSLRRLARRAPLVCTVHDVVPHQQRVPVRLQRALLARQYATAGTIVVHHPSVGTRLCAEFDVDPERVHFVPWAVPEVDALPKAAPADVPTVLLFGTLRRNKGIDVALAAADRLAGIDCRIVVAGRGFADVEEQVRAAAARDPRIVAEIGFVSEERKHELYRSADLVVLPYTSFSSQSAVLHDAYAHHRPVVVSDVGALGSAVREDSSGRVVAPGDPDALAEAIAASLSDHTAWAAAATGARHAAEARHPTLVAEALRAVYQGAAGR